MQIARLYTVAGTSPYDGIAFHTVEIGDSELWDSPEGPRAVSFPQSWSLTACEALARWGLHQTIPAALRRIEERDVPAWLWRSVADEAALDRLPQGARHRAETNARQVFDRLAGAWTYHGWKAGYFDSAEDAAAFHDEVRFLLCRQLVAPEGTQWGMSGLYWAYGIEAGHPGWQIADWRSGHIVEAGPDSIAPHGAAILGVRDADTGPAAILEAWSREATARHAGLATALNLTRAAQALDDTGLSASLAAGASAAALADVMSDWEATPPDRLVALDADHPGIGEFVAWQKSRDDESAARETGSRIVARHLRAIAESCQGRRRAGLNPERNPALRLALMAAREAMVPDSAIETVLKLVREGRPVPEFPVFEGDREGAGNRHAVRIGDALMSTLEQGADGSESGRSLLDDIAAAGWRSGAMGVQFAAATDGWNGCAMDGSIRASSADGSAAFLDDTACSRATINLLGFLRDDGTVDTARLRHAAGIATVALDIVVSLTGQPDSRLAAGTWRYRPLGLEVGNAGAALRAMGIAYDSDEGRATVAALVALVTGAACQRSALMAETLGAFPAFAENRGAMLRVLSNHARAAAGERDGYDGLPRPPLTLDADYCADPGLADAVRQSWRDALALAASHGVRNAQFSLVAGLRCTGAILGCSSLGIEPDHALVLFEALPGGSFQKIANPLVPRALTALGYDAADVHAIIRHLVGHGTLRGSPHINHESLRRVGFNQAALDSLEAGLANCLDIRHLFNRWTLGDEFCRRALGFTDAQLGDYGFDMLAALGFDTAEVASANVYCCGALTLEGTPLVDPAHLAVFDAIQPQGPAGKRTLAPEAMIRMMAAAQPFVSGGIAHALRLPQGATIDACREALMLGWRLGLKGLTVARGGNGDADGTTQKTLDIPQSDRGAPTLAPSAEPEHHLVVVQDTRPNDAHNERADATGTPDAHSAETLRCSATEPAQSAASGPLRPDAVVEQRQV